MARPSQHPKSAPVPATRGGIDSLGVHAIDRRRVDVAVDLTPCRQPLTVELVIVGPNDDELCSVLMIDNTEWTLDRIMHLRHDAADGEHTLHVGIFSGNELLARASRCFRFPHAARSGA